METEYQPFYNSDVIATYGERNQELEKRNHAQEKREECDLTTHFQTIKTMVLTAARIVFARKWKDENIPTKEDIIFKVLDLAEMERLTYIIQEKSDWIMNLWLDVIVLLCCARLQSIVEEVSYQLPKHKPRERRRTNFAVGEERKGRRVALSGWLSSSQPLSPSQNRQRYSPHRCLRRRRPRHVRSASTRRRLSGQAQPLAAAAAAASSAAAILPWRLRGKRPGSARSAPRASASSSRRGTQSAHRGCLHLRHLFLLLRGHRPLLLFPLFSPRGLRPVSAAASVGVVVVAAHLAPGAARGSVSPVPTCLGSVSSPRGPPDEPQRAALFRSCSAAGWLLPASWQRLERRYTRPRLRERRFSSLTCRAWPGARGRRRLKPKEAKCVRGFRALDVCIQDTCCRNRCTQVCGRVGRSWN
ncbi:PREDICTED: uncharacterized protein LOC107109080 [Gekko japonicus]|uniref:Uncharacterized protein LOC107109080 n=1 Tax=Gekko japonicus TaxID=146911 RepID=A0ABM1JUK6_GEKJA|nr:PREDICTED: uncharacterized protein LOC107109080 [Gekko japonicus]